MVSKVLLSAPQKGNTTIRENGPARTSSGISGKAKRREGGLHGSGILNISWCVMT